MGVATIPPVNSSAKTSHDLLFTVADDLQRSQESASDEDRSATHVTLLRDCAELQSSVIGVGRGRVCHTPGQVLLDYDELSGVRSLIQTRTGLSLAVARPPVESDVGVRVRSQMSWTSSVKSRRFCQVQRVARSPCGRHVGCNANGEGEYDMASSEATR